MEESPRFEQEGSAESPKQKHIDWVKEARALMEITGFSLITQLSASAILNNLGLELSPYLISALSLPATYAFAKRNRKLN